MIIVMDWCILQQKAQAKSNEASPARPRPASRVRQLAIASVLVLKRFS